MPKKKNIIVKMEPQTVKLFAVVLQKLKPPPPLTISQWADKYRVLSSESSAEPADGTRTRLRTSGPLWMPSVIRTSGK